MMRPPRLGVLLFLAAGLSVCAPGCKKEEAKKVAPEKVRPVRAITVQPETRPVRLPYIGTTGSATIKAYAFRQGGRLVKVYVEKGDRVKPGQLLARLDPADYELAQSASDLNLTKAEEALKDAERTKERIQALVEEGARPEQDLEQARLAVEVRRATVEQARIEQKAKSRMVADTRLRSEVTGYVVDVRSRAGELVGGGYPVVVVRAEQQVVKVGVAQRDIARLKVGAPALVRIDDREGPGKVTGIAQVPDRTSRTYEVEVSLEGELGTKPILLGSIARVAFEVGDLGGIWVPIPSVLTEGENYVFTIQGGRASRKAVRLHDVSGAWVRVEGLKAGDQVITEGMKTLKEGYRVEVKS